VAGVALGTLLVEQATAIAAAAVLLLVVPLATLVLSEDVYAWLPIGAAEALAGLETGSTCSRRRSARSCSRRSPPRSSPSPRGRWRGGTSGSAAASRATPSGAAARPDVVGACALVEPKDPDGGPS